MRGLDDDSETVEEAAGHRLIAPGSGFYCAVLGRDVESWRRELLGAEERWFRPLLDEMTGGRLRRVAIDAGFRTGRAVFEAAGRRARAPSVRIPSGGLVEFLLAESA